MPKFVILRCALAVAVVTGMPALAQQLVGNQKDASFFAREITLRPGELTRQSAEMQARDFLSKYKRKFKILRLTMGIDQADVMRQVGGKGSMHVSYQEGVQMHVRSRDSVLRLPMAEMLSIGEGSVLRWRSSQGEMARIILYGEDSLRINIPGSLFEIKHIAASVLPPFLREVPHEQHLIHYYIVTPNRLSKDKAKLLTRHLVRVAGVRQIDVRLAQDIWFLDDPYFPAVYRFEPLGDIPNAETYRRRPTIYCSHIEGKIDCQGPDP